MDAVTSKTILKYRHVIEKTHILCSNVRRDEFEIISIIRVRIDARVLYTNWSVPITTIISTYIILCLRMGLQANELLNVIFYAK